MILLERLNAQIQEGTTSYAIISQRTKNNNPAVTVFFRSGFFVWDFIGLNNGSPEQVAGQARQNHFDFYIGMDDLFAQFRLLPTTHASSLGLTANGLRNPNRSVRLGGTRIPWLGPLARLTTIEDLEMQIPPFKVKKNPAQSLILNIDKEFSPYSIDNGNGRTKRELHFGFGENLFIIRQKRNITVPCIQVKMTPQQYATVLEAINRAILLHRTP